MRGNYQSVQEVLPGMQVLILAVIIALTCHCNDCAGQHSQLIRKQVKQECLRD